MDLFYVNSEGLYDIADMLNNLMIEWTSNIRKAPSCDLSCGGMTTELVNLVKQYEDLHTAMEELLQNTIDMFSKVGATLDEIDGEMSDVVFKG